MNRKRYSARRLLISLLAVGLVGVAMALPASAEGQKRAVMPAKEPRAEGRLDLELVFQKDGSWLANITLQDLAVSPAPGFPAELTLDKLELKDWTPESLEAMLRAMGQPSDIPPGDPEVVAQMQALGIEHLALRERALDGYDEMGIYVNNRLLFALQVSEALTKAAIQQMGAANMPVDVSAPAGIGKTTVSMRFPSKGEAGAVSFADEIEPVAVSPVNIIKVGATLDNMPGGMEIVSLAGFTTQEIEGVLEQTSPGLLLPTLMTTLFKDLGIERVDAKLGTNGLEIDAGEGRWAKLVWDRDSRAAIWDLASQVAEQTGMDLQPDLEGLVYSSMCLRLSRATVYVAGQSQEGAPMIHLGRPFLVEVADNGLVYVAGQVAGAVGQGMMQPYLPIGVRLDGEELALRSIVQGDKALPYLFLGKGGLAALGDRLSPLRLPWDKIEGLVPGVDVTVIMVPKGQGVPTLNLDYAALDLVAPIARLVPRIAVDTKGRFGVGEPPILLSGIAETLGMMPLEDQVWPWVAAYSRPGDLYSLTIDGRAIELGLNYRPVVGMRWGPILRDNVIRLVPIAPLPYPLEEIIPYWKGFVTELLLQPQWGVELKVEKEIPPSVLDELVVEAKGLIEGSGR